MIHKRQCVITKEILNCRFNSKTKFYQIQTNGPQIRICFLTEDIVRVRASFDKVFKEQSYALSMTAWPDRFDDLLGSLRKRVEPVEVKFQENERLIEFKTKKLLIKLQKKPYSLSVINDNGNILYQDLAGRAYKKDLQGRVYNYSQIDQDNDCFYGFGQNTGSFNKKSQIIRIAPKDSLGYDAQTTSPLYKHIPFYIKINKIHKEAIGIFYNNTFESIFDMGCQRSGYWNRYSYFCADGGDIDCYFINGPTFSEVLKRYTDLTGKTAFTPMQSLGYLGSTMYYVEFSENCDKQIINFVEKNKKEGIPISNFHLSSGYTMLQNKKKRCVFTWNSKRFENPEKFFQQMNERGVSVSPNIKPGILTCHPLYESFKKRNAFVLDSEGKNEYIDSWWGGEGSFIDFTNPQGREAWKHFMTQELLKKGTTSIWNDNCQYESLDDRGAVCSFDLKKQGGIIDELKSVQSLLMAHCSYEAIHQLKPGVRPFIINRCGYAGIQKYASTWAGDNYTNWKSLKYNISTILNMGLSGVANQGCDIGGFWGPAPQSQLLLRWIQHGIFQPRFSIHSCNSDNTVTQPWMYQQIKQLIKQSMNFRYTLIPYLYSLLYEAHVEGSPIMRPLIYQFQEDLNCYDISDIFLVGKSLLVANVLEKNAKKRNVYFPTGSNWYCWYTNKIYKGGSYQQIDVDLSSIPIFIRDSGIVPTTQNFTNINKETINELNIKICLEKSSQFLLFEDDGKSYGYLQNKCLKTLIKVSKREAGEIYEIDFQKQGDYQTSVKNMTLQIKVIDKAPTWVTIINERIPKFLQKNQCGWYFNHSTGSVFIKYQNILTNYNVTICFDKMINFKEELD